MKWLKAMDEDGYYYGYMLAVGDSQADSDDALAVMRSEKGPHLLDLVEQDRLDCGQLSGEIEYDFWAGRTRYAVEQRHSGSRALHLRRV